MRECSGCGATDESDDIAWHDGYDCLLCAYCREEADDENRIFDREGIDHSADDEE